MRDLLWLRAQLRAALLLTPLAACGPTTTPPPDEPISNRDDTATDPPQSPEVPWPVAQGCGSDGQFCAPVRQVAAAAAADTPQFTTAATGCPENFQHDGLFYNHDPQASQAQAAADTCCYYYGDGCAIGRPLLDGGRAQVASVREGGAWARRGAATEADIAPAVRARLAAGWLEDALFEHASVASFARATLELMALGAPAALLADTQRAALDEVRHAELCFGLVERYLGRRVSPGPIAAVTPRPAELVRLAVDTFVEGCVAETVATLAATRVLARCQDAEVAAVLARIIRDETRHAALAWRTIAWAAAQGGAPVIAALRAQAAAMTPGPAIAGVDDVADEALLAHGRLDGATRRAAVVDAWREIIAPTLVELLGPA